jgi:hypothetical protein
LSVKLVEHLRVRGGVTHDPEVCENIRAGYRRDPLHSGLGIGLIPKDVKLLKREVTR